MAADSSNVTLLRPLTHNDDDDERIAPLGGHLLLVFALLVLINLIVILGNILVIVAIYATAKLRNVTNIFIVSLATADLMLGVFVLPYALTYEVSIRTRTHAGRPSNDHCAHLQQCR